jgi:hypothetical protein
MDIPICHICLSRGDLPHLPWPKWTAIAELGSFVLLACKGCSMVLCTSVEKWEAIIAGKAGREGG